MQTLIDWVMLSLGLGVVIFIGKSFADLLKNPALSQREKANLSWLIFAFPIFGSLLFYFYSLGAERRSQKSR